MGAVNAAQLLMSDGDTPDRLYSEAAFAMPCAACPMPASSGRLTRYRLNRGGDRQTNSALHSIAVVRLHTDAPTLSYAYRLPMRIGGIPRTRRTRRSCVASIAELKAVLAIRQRRLPSLARP